MTGAIPRVETGHPESELFDLTQARPHDRELGVSERVAVSREWWRGCHETVRVSGFAVGDRASHRQFPCDRDERQAASTPIDHHF